MATEAAPKIEVSNEDLSPDNDRLIVPELESSTPPLEVTDADVFAKPDLAVTSEDVAQKSGDTTGLEDIVNVGSTGRAYRVKKHDNGWKSAQFISNEHVDTIRAYQDQIRDGLDEREAQYLSREAGRRNPDRLAVSALDSAEVAVHNAAERVSKILVEARDTVADMRTPSEVVSDIGDKASELIDSAKATGVEKAKDAKEAVTKIGKKAGSKLINVVTAPGRAMDKAFEAGERGMANIEARAKSAKQRKAARIADRNMKRSIRTQERQDIAVAKEAKKGIKRDAKKAERDQKGLDKLKAETKRNQDIAAKRELARQKAEAARNQKAARRAEKARRQQESIDAWAKRTIERKEKVKAKAQKLGRGVVDTATTGYYAASNKGSEALSRAKTAAEKAKAKAEAERKAYHTNRGHKAARRAAEHLNKTTRGDEEYRVPVMFEDGKDS